jgi:homopolymeric O-antigen transport system permease protein
MISEPMDNTSVSATNISSQNDHFESRLNRAAADILDGLAHVHLWYTVGWLEIKQRYRRSVIGPFWITLSLGIMLAGMGIIYSRLFGMETEHYIPFLSAGLVVWALMSTLLTEGCTTFLSSEGVIKQLPAPLSVHALRVVWRNLIILAHNSLIYFGVMAYFHRNPGPVVLLAPFGIALIAINGFAACLTLGIFSARFRDIPPIISNAVQVIFFMTPVFWDPQNLKGRTTVLHVNPLYYLLELVRRPLLGEAPPLTLWLAVLAITLANLAVGLAMFVRFRGRIAYWL